MFQISPDYYFIYLDFRTYVLHLKKILRVFPNTSFAVQGFVPFNDTCLDFLNKIFAEANRGNSSDSMELVGELEKVWLYQEDILRPPPPRSRMHLPDHQNRRLATQKWWRKKCGGSENNFTHWTLN